MRRLSVNASHASYYRRYLDASLDALIPCCARSARLLHTSRTGATLDEHRWIAMSEIRSTRGRIVLAGVVVGAIKATGGSSSGGGGSLHGGTATSVSRPSSITTHAVFFADVAPAGLALERDLLAPAASREFLGLTSREPLSIATALATDLA